MTSEVIPLNPDRFEKSQLMPDAIFAAIEKRQLQFLLRGKERKAYQNFLKQSKEYKAMIRQLNWF